MSYLKTIEEVQTDLSDFKNEWVLLYGSWIRGSFIPERSDIDIVILSKQQEKNKNLALWQSYLGKVPPVYEIRIFEILPTHIQMEIHKNYIVIFGDVLEISEYLYSYYNKWRDMEYRMKWNRFLNFKEKQDGLKRRKLLEKK